MKATAVFAVLLAAAFMEEVWSDRQSFRAASKLVRESVPSEDLPPGTHPFGREDAPPQSLVAPVEKSEGRIIQGEEAEPCQFPHQVALDLHMYYGRGFCGGSLIAPRWVLTAAHCVEEVYRGIDVRAGSNDVTQGVARKAKRIFFHGDFGWHLRNDVALIELDEEMPISDCLKPVELETSGCDSDALDNIAAVVSGWGNTEGGSMPRNLLWTRATTITNAQCLDAFNENHVDRRTICTKPFNSDHDGTLCQGDSGGALLREDTGRQIGINSFTSSLGCTAHYPSGYARVPCLIDWINHVMTL